MKMVLREISKRRKTTAGALATLIFLAMVFLPEFSQNEDMIIQEAESEEQVRFADGDDGRDLPNEDDFPFLVNEDRCRQSIRTNGICECASRITLAILNEAEDIWAFVERVEFVDDPDPNNIYQINTNNIDFSDLPMPSYRIGNEDVATAIQSMTPVPHAREAFMLSCTVFKAEMVATHTSVYDTRYNPLGYYVAHMLHRSDRPYWLTRRVATNHGTLLGAIEGNPQYRADVNNLFAKLMEDVQIYYVSYLCTATNWWHLWDDKEQGIAGNGDWMITEFRTPQERIGWLFAKSDPDSDGLIGWCARGARCLNREWFDTPSLPDIPADTTTTVSELTTPTESPRTTAPTENIMITTPEVTLPPPTENTPPSITPTEPTNTPTLPEPVVTTATTTTTTPRTTTSATTTTRTATTTRTTTTTRATTPPPPPPTSPPTTDWGDAHI